MRVLVTGAGGFVGRRLCVALSERRCSVLAHSRRQSVASVWPPLVEFVGGNEIDGPVDLSVSLARCDVVVHLAARVHVMNDKVADPLAAYRACNTEGTLRLARQAVAAGVRRFVFVSSIKVNGESSPPGWAFTEASVLMPNDDYAVSKHEAEVGLWKIAYETGLEIVVIRPPIVYGPGVRANFLEMMHWLRYGSPLPFGAVRYNRRSLVGLDNLVDLITTCVNHPAAANQIFLAGDGADLSTAELLQRVGQFMEVPVRLLPVPIWGLEAVAFMAGRRAVVQRLCGNLQVDISKAQRVLGWVPPVSLDEGLKLTADWYRREFMCNDAGL